MNDSLVEFTKPVMAPLAMSERYWGAACVFLWTIHFACSINKELERQTFPLLFFLLFRENGNEKLFIASAMTLILFSNYFNFFFLLILFEREIHRGFFLSRPNGPGTLNPPASDSKLVQLCLAAYSDFKPHHLTFLFFFHWKWPNIQIYKYT